MVQGQIVALNEWGRRRTPELYVRPGAFGPVWLPALRVGMGMLVGLVFSLVCGNLAFWLGVGAVLGGVMAGLLPPEPRSSSVLCLPAPARCRVQPAYPDRSLLLSVQEAA
jgi:hypothetical protein